MPGRTARPVVDVKRALPVGASRPSSPLVARRLGLGSAAAPRQAALPTSSATHPDPTVVADATAGPDHEEPMSPQPTRTHRPTRPQGRSVAARSGPSLLRRRVRAGLLVAALLWVPTSIVLAAVGVLLWMSVPFAVLTVGAVLVYLRTEVAADRVRAEGRSRSDERPADGFDEFDDVEDGSSTSTRPRTPSRVSSRATTPR